MKQLTLLIIIIASLLVGCTHSHQQANERIDSLYAQGDRYLNTDQWDSAMIVFSEAERLLNPQTDLVKRGRIYASLGYLWHNNNNIPIGIEYQEKALQAYEAGGDENRSALTLIVLGDYHSNLKTPENYKKAFDYIERAQNFYPHVNDSTRGSILQFKGLVHFFSNQWDSAIVYFHKAYPYPDESTYKCINRLYLGISHFKMGQLDSAKLYVKEAQKIPAGFRQRSGCCNMLHRIAKAEGDSMAAQHYASLLIAYKDSTMHMEGTISRQAVALDSQADLVRDKQYKRQTALISGFIIVVLIVGCCVLRIRTRRHKTKEKQLQAVVQSTKQELLDEQIAHRHTREEHQVIREEKIKLRLQTLRSKYQPTQEHWNEKQWESLLNEMSQNGDLFVNNLKNKHPKISSEEVKLCLLVLLNYTEKEIAHTLNLAHSTINTKKRRMAKKMGKMLSNLRPYLLSLFE